MKVLCFWILTMSAVLQVRWSFPVLYVTSTKPRKTARHIVSKPGKMKFSGLLRGSGMSVRGRASLSASCKALLSLKLTIGSLDFDIIHVSLTTLASLVNTFNGTSHSQFSLSMKKNVFKRRIGSQLGSEVGV